MEFKLIEGPWTKLFEGKFQEHEVEIYSNPESMIIVLIFEKKDKKRVGAVIEIYKIFSSKGDVDSFIETLPKNVLALTKHDPESTIKFFILSSNPSYVRYTEEQLNNEINTLIKRIKTSSKMIIDVSKAYHIEFKEIAECSAEVKEAFFSQPLIVPLLSTASHESIFSEHGLMELSGDVILGVTKNGLSVKEPLTLFRKTLVFDGNEKERLHAIHILVEGCLLSNVATVVIDSGEWFSGLSTPTKNLTELQHYKVDIEPIGFPVKDFQVPTNVKIDLSLMNASGILEVFGVGDETIVKKIAEVLKSKSFSSITAIVQQMEKEEALGDWNEFQKLKTIRILKLLDLRYPNLFNGSNDLKEISKSWVKGIGRAGIIHLSDQDNRAALMILQSILSGLLQFYKEQGTTRKLRSMIVMPRAPNFVPATEENILTKQIVSDLIALQDYGVGFILGAEKELDIAKKLTSIAEARVSIISANDIGIQLKGRKNYRVLARPGLSECSEL